MNIEIIKTSENSCIESSLDSIRSFGLILNKNITFIKMAHWFILNYNIHEILGELYSDMDILFDTLEEEIIGTSKKYEILFPKFNSTLFQIENLDLYKNDEIILENLHVFLDNLKNILTSLEFNDYITKVKSGLNNTKEDIITRINKTLYLLSML